MIFFSLGAGWLAACLNACRRRSRINFGIVFAAAAAAAIGTHPPFLFSFSCCIHIEPWAFFTQAFSHLNVSGSQLVRHDD